MLPFCSHCAIPLFNRSTRMNKGEKMTVRFLHEFSALATFFAAAYLWLIVA